MLTQQQFYNFLDAALTFFGTIGTTVTVTSAIYAVIATRRIDVSERSSWDILGAAVNIGIADGFLVGIPPAVLLLVLGQTGGVLVSRYILAFGFGVVIACITGLLLPTNALGAGWVFLIDVVSTGVFAWVSGRQRFRGETVQMRVGA